MQNRRAGLEPGDARVRAHPPPKGGLKVVLRVQPEGWKVPRDSFFQNNFFLLPHLVKTVRDCLRESGARFLLDLYCGVGFFSVELADLVDSFAGVELDKQAVEAARHNALARHCGNGEFLVGRAEEMLPSLLRRFPPEKTAVILDPPRKGARAKVCCYCASGVRPRSFVCPAIRRHWRAT